MLQAKIVPKALSYRIYFLRGTLVKLDKTMSFIYLCNPFDPHQNQVSFIQSIGLLFLYAKH